MAVIISLHSRAEHISPRQRTPDNTQWQSSRAPLEPLWKELVTGLFLAGFLLGLIVLCGG